MKQIPLFLGPPPDYTFDNYLPGDNEALLAHLDALQLGDAPVYIWGPSGSGKTHVLRALAQRWQEAGAQVGWYDANTPQPWELPHQPSLLLMDDCERFDPGQQHAAFTLFVEAASQGLAVVAAGAAPSVDLPLREDVRTRLAWGPTFALQPLSEEEVRAVLHREAARRGVVLGDEVVSYLQTRFARDLKHLMHLLDRLDEFSLASQRAITVPLLRRMLSEPDTAP
ncbi:DnaA regulatory inactivator Hda [Roseateles sp. BYS180W]|uniref:DnaA regulatory inactivator Hda n=1 Tax=Roseateles rivi TaxID=3299028 RepID=A0ABW7FYP8_9BURK